MGGGDDLVGGHHEKLQLYAARGLIQSVLADLKDIGRALALIEVRGIQIRVERAALAVGASGNKMRVSTTQQIRIEEGIARRPRGATRRRTDALESAAVAAPTEGSGPDSERSNSWRCSEWLYLFLHHPE